MTFHPDQVMTNEDWQKLHEGHDVIDGKMKRYRFMSRKAEKRMHYWYCKTCEKSHLHKMETVEL